MKKEEKNELIKNAWVKLYRLMDGVKEVMDNTTDVNNNEIELSDLKRTLSFLDSNVKQIKRDSLNKISKSKKKTPSNELSDFELVKGVYNSVVALKEKYNITDDEANQLLFLGLYRNSCATMQIDEETNTIKSIDIVFE